MSMTTSRTWIGMVVIGTLAVSTAAVCVRPARSSCSSCTYVCQSTWIADGSCQAVNVPDDAWEEIPACRNFTTTALYFCSSAPPAGFVASGCVLTGYPGVCCARSISDPGTVDPLSYMVRLPKDGSYPQCCQPGS